ncbi:flagellar motor protein MotB [Aromatoleum toluclasticum]|uniref:flagellar motor protein MotB n=1 Tax=Aromatoleum toluclasticum TaxID=92003 RepID=UPI001D1893C3|nr:flagellar motor protein MotB [Aromatoleum toluclasticum]MCC4116882.1 flagellar motor protein MotB [Aromatoleum toluclasticum]
MSDDTQQPIVVKRINKVAAAAHGGAWKIAYADFVTAMMAFFLLMWLLGSTAQGDLEGIADHFMNPLKVSMQGGSGAGDSSSVIQGGGEDLTRSLGQRKRGEVEGRRSINLDAAKGREVYRVEGEDEGVEATRERARLEDLKGRIEALVEADPKLRPFRSQILLDITSEGLRIQIVDAQNRPMFNTASDELLPHTRELLRAIGRALNDVSNRLSLSGHTDSARYAGGERGFSNWELSSNRANASRRELVAGGLEAGKVIRVVGLADMVPLRKDDLLHPMNRRISIIVMNKKTEEAVRNQAGALDIGLSAPLDGGDLRENIESRNQAPAAPVRGRSPLPLPLPPVKSP